MEGPFGIAQGLKGTPVKNVPDQHFVGCGLFRSTNQTIATAGSYVAVIWDKILFDTDNMIDLTRNNTRITIKTPGWYFVHGNTEWNTGSSTGERDQKFLVNGLSNAGVMLSPLPGGTIARKDMYTVDWARCSIPVNITSVNTIHFSFFPFYFNSGDYIELYVAQNSGGDLAIVSDNSRPNFGCWRVGS